VDDDALRRLDELEDRVSALEELAGEARRQRVPVTRETALRFSCPEPGCWAKVSAPCTGKGGRERSSVHKSRLDKARGMINNRPRRRGSTETAP
jgi:hypothetical protein